MGENTRFFFSAFREHDSGDQAGGDLGEVLYLIWFTSPFVLKKKF